MSAATGGQGMTRCRKCAPVVFHHADGWDVYPATECQRTETGELVPRWFDAPIVEDFPTRKAALAELAEMHPFGICLITATTATDTGVSA